jgi:beta-galactosidase
MVFMTRRIAPTPLSPTDPGYEPDLQRRQHVLFADWTPANSNSHEEKVEVYSNCEQVELFLNGKSLGEKALPADASPRTWTVQFAPGTLRAVGKNKGRVAASYELRTAGKPARIALNADRNSLTPVWDDLVYVNATVVDDNGVLVPNASDLITFKISGPGVIAAVESGDNTSHEPFQASERRAYQGRCFAILKAAAASGRITIEASASGLKSNALIVNAVGAKVKMK